MTLPNTMHTMVTIGHGDHDQMVLRTDWPRTGRYSKTNTDDPTGKTFSEIGQYNSTSGGAPITFPRMQGADVCGRIVTVDAGADAARIGKRVITDGWSQDANGPTEINKGGFCASERDGGRYTYSGSIEGPMFDMDLPTFYLRAWTRTDSTVITPARAATYPLDQLGQTQIAFIAKQLKSNIVVCP